MRHVRFCAVQTPRATISGSRTEVTAEQMEIRRLRAELARVTMERDILGKATAFFAKGQK
jgi:transposase